MRLLLGLWGTGEEGGSLALATPAAKRDLIGQNLQFIFHSGRSNMPAKLSFADGQSISICAFRSSSEIPPFNILRMRGRSGDSL